MTTRANDGACLQEVSSGTFHRAVPEMTPAERIVEALISRLPDVRERSGLDNNAASQGGRERNAVRDDEAVTAIKQPDVK